MEDAHGVLVGDRGVRVGGQREELAKLGRHDLDPVAHAFQVPVLALDGRDHLGCALQRAFVGGPLEGAGVVSRPGPREECAGRGERAGGSDRDVPPVPAGDERAGDRAGDRGDQQRAPHQLRDDGLEVDAHVALEALRHRRVARECLRGVDVDLVDAGLERQRGVVRVEANPPERRHEQRRVAAARPPHAHCDGAGADVARGGTEGQRRDRGGAGEQRGQEEPEHRAPAGRRGRRGLGVPHRSGLTVPVPAPGPVATGTRAGRATRGTSAAAVTRHSAIGLIGRCSGLRPRLARPLQRTPSACQRPASDPQVGTRRMRCTPTAHRDPSQGGPT